MRGCHIIHVDADGTTSRANARRGEEDVEAGAAAEVDDGFSLGFRNMLVGVELKDG